MKNFLSKGKGKFLNYFLSACPLHTFGTGLIVLLSYFKIPQYLVQVFPNRRLKAERKEGRGKGGKEDRREAKREGSKEGGKETEWSVIRES